MRSSSADADPARSVEPGLLDGEAKAAFHLRLRARGIRDLGVLRAMERVPRQSFVPHHYLDLAMRDLALPIGCGQTLNEPWLIARMIEALGVESSHRVLQVGAGTGYATAILAHLCGDVIGVERYQSLAVAAQARLADLGLANAAVVWGDGLALPAQVEPFDRIIVHGLLEPLPAGLLDRLEPDGGVVVHARMTPAGPGVVRLTKGEETPVCACRLQPIVPGLGTI